MKQLLPLCFFAFAHCATAQNVGIGTPTPLALLHVSGITAEKLRLENTTALNTNISSDLFFKTGLYFTGGIKTIGTGTSYARLGLFTYAVANNANLIERLSVTDAGNVGIGTTTPNAKLEVNGTMKITDGTEGDKKVLTSDATGNATWQNQAFGNTERFYFRFKLSNSAAPATTQLYNYGTATANFVSPYFQITIAKAGLYHFDVNFDAYVTGNYSNSFVELYTAVSTGVADIYYAHPFWNYHTTLNSSYITYDKSFDVYIPAGGNIRFYNNNYILGGGPIYSLIQNIGGQLIAD